MNKRIFKERGATGVKAVETAFPARPLCPQFYHRPSHVPLTHERFQERFHRSAPASSPQITGYFTTGTHNTEKNSNTNSGD